MTTLDEAVTRFETFEREGRLLRGQWTSTDAWGRALACWLAALSSEVAADKDASACPASLLWPWLAHLTVWLDDAGSEDTWPDRTRRYGAMLRSLARLTDEQREAIGPLLDYRVRAACVREAMRYIDSGQALAACETVAVLCERAGRGERVSEKEWTEAARESEAEASESAADASEAAVWAARAAARAAACAARAAAEAAACAARAAARAAAEAADRLIDTILTTIETGIAEAASR